MDKYHKEFVLGACRTARLVIDSIPSRYSEPRRAVELAEKFVNGGTIAEEEVYMAAKQMDLDKPRPERYPDISYDQYQAIRACYWAAMTVQDPENYMSAVYCAADALAITEWRKRRVDTGS